jgi:hypothetical protein
VTFPIGPAPRAIVGPFAELPGEKAHEMVRLNVLAVADLTLTGRRRRDAPPQTVPEARSDAISSSV